MMRMLLVTALTLLLTAPPANAAAPADVADQVQPKVAKIYGAGGLRGLEAYQSGVVISASGHILTVWSYVLDSDAVTIVLNDGRRYEAVLAGADPRLDVAVLKPREEMADLAYFDLEHSPTAAGGSRILAFSNCFSVAAGEEAASVQRGAVLAVVPLNARRGVFEAAYRGPVYVLDAVTSNPGAAGGAITDDSGHLVGIIGRELRNNVNGTWLNYAMPISELRNSVTRIQAGELAPAASLASETPVANPWRLGALGATMLPDVLERTPAYIDAITENSPAAKAGLLPEDLILMVDGRLVNGRAALEQELARHEAESPLKITVLREQTLMELEITPVK